MNKEHIYRQAQIKTVAIGFLLILCLLGCKKTTEPEPAETPTIQLKGAYPLTETRAEFLATITVKFPGEVDEYGVAWGQNALPTTADNHKAATQSLSIKSPPDFSVTADNLQAGVKYNARAYVRIGSQTFYSEVLTFTQQTFSQWKKQRDIPNEAGAPMPDPSNNEAETSYLMTVLRRNTNDVTATPWTYHVYTQTWNRTTKDVLAIYSPIRFVFRDKTGDVQDIVSGAGYYLTSQTPPYRVYQKALTNDNNTPITPYPGSDAPTTSFVLGQTGYVIEQTAQGATWQFDYLFQTWKRGKPFPYPGGYLIAYTVQGQAYLLLESLGDAPATGRFLRYDPATDTYLPLATFPGENRRNGVHFTLSGKLYYGAGESLVSHRGLRDLWQYDPAINRWKQVADYPGTGQATLNAVRLGDRVIIGLGYQVNATNNGVAEYKQATDLWIFTP